jgi:UDP-N-acetylmuramoylalanine--D-glutamate ligase
MQVMTGCESIPEGPFDVAIASPGIPQDTPWMCALRDRGVTIKSELELGAEHCHCPMLAITGTNGKSTLAKLCGDALSRAGHRVAVAGNYGLPLSAVAPDSNALDWAVVEVSSFQLETVTDFHPRVAVILNLQPDHLDRHPDMDTYLAMKARLFRQVEPGDTCVAPLGLVDSLEAALGESGHACSWTTFGDSADADFRYAAHGVQFGHNGSSVSVPVAGSYFDNEVLGLSVAAAAAALRGCDCPDAALRDAVQAFEPLAHRMQEVAVLRGVHFINDSKATNLSAMDAALGMCPPSSRLIAGGILKTGNLADVEERLANKISCVYVIGRDADTLLEAWSGTVACRRCDDLETAVRTAWREAREGEAIVLSPGCASFDQFDNFEDRGSQFVHIVKQIEKEI